MVDLCPGHSLTVLVIMLRGQHVHQPHPVYVERGRRTLAFPFRGQRQPKSLVPAKAMIMNAVKYDYKYCLEINVMRLPRLYKGYRIFFYMENQTAV